MTLPRFRSLPLIPAGGLIYLATLLVFGGVLAWVTLNVRADLRREIGSRDAQAIAALARMEYLQVQGEYTSLPEDLRRNFLLGEVVLNVSVYEGILGAAVLGTGGEAGERIPVDLEIPAAPAGLSTNEVPPDARFAYRPEGSLADFLPGAGREPVPLQEIVVPLRDPDTGESMGAGYFLLDGSSLAAAYRTMDGQLLRQAALAYLAGAVLILFLLGLAYLVLRRAHRALNARTRSLVEANNALNLALKNSAIGNVTAHLLHDLKNPISGLQMFFEEARAKENAEIPHDRLDSAIEHTRRMQTLVQEVVGILQEDHGGVFYNLSLEEWLQPFRQKIAGRAEAKGVHFETSRVPEVELTNHEANLLTWIVLNLVQNAIEASPAGETVFVEFAHVGTSLRVSVLDQGPGIPEPMREQLFKPLKSTKADGSGIGLAISHHLARALDAELRLDASKARGACFVLTLPLSLENTPVPASR